MPACSLSLLLFTRGERYPACMRYACAMDTELHCIALLLQIAISMVHNSMPVLYACLVLPGVEFQGAIVTANEADGFVNVGLIRTESAGQETVSVRFLTLQEFLSRDTSVVGSCQSTLESQVEEAQGVYAITLHGGGPNWLI